VGAHKLGKGCGERRQSRYDPELTPDSIKGQVQKIWRSLLSDASSIINWSEGSFWNIEAIVEDEDGATSELLSDGWHVRVRDRQGKFWYARAGSRVP
jgi:hypothetical protein